MAMGLKEARHLMGRAGFGGRPDELEALASMGRKAAVRRLLATARTKASRPGPSWGMEGTPSAAERESMSRKELRRLSKARGEQIQAWWMKEMLETSSPVTERMTLVWHNHFTSSLRKVKWSPFLYRQNVLLRRHALGNFEALLRGVIRDPAMMFYLDNQSNRKRDPNENFARELLELFTLGEGHYSEKDIKEAARAFTGWRVRRRTGDFRFVKADHDKGQKHFLGKRGDFDGDGIVDVLLAHPRTAERIVEMLWGEFISETPTRKDVVRLAKVFRSAKYEIKPLLEAIWTSDAFWDTQNRGALVKSPVDLVVGTVRTFGLKIGDPTPLLKACRQLGQIILQPPNVKGWPGGTRWISTHTLLARHQLLSRVVRKGLGKGDGAMNRWLGDNNQSDKAAIKKAQAVLLPLDPVGQIASKGDRALAQLLLDPTYQLK